MEDNSRARWRRSSGDILRIKPIKTFHASGDVSAGLISYIIYYLSSQILQVARHRFDAAIEVRQVELFVGRVQVVVGRPVGAKTQSKFFVGNVPIRPPRPDAWGSPFLNVPVFEPPAIDPSPIDGIAHINLDLALEFLLGDRLR